MLKEDLNALLHVAKPFRYLTVDELDRMAAYCDIVTFNDGDIILRQGEKSKGLYIVLEGKAFLSAKVLGSDLLDLATVDKGDFVGEVGLMVDMPNSMSVIAKGNITCLFITKLYFDTLALFLGEIKYKINQAIMEEVCARLTRIHAKITELMSHSAMATRSIFSEVIHSLTLPKVIDFADIDMDISELKKRDFFNLLTQEELTVLLNESTLIETAPHNTLIKTGDSDSPVFVLLCGAVQSRVIKDNKIAKVSVLSPINLISSFFPMGVAAVFDYSTCEQAVLLKINRAHLLHLKENNIHLWYKIVDLICREFLFLEIAANKLFIRLQSELYNR